MGRGGDIHRLGHFVLQDQHGDIGPQGRVRHCVGRDQQIGTRNDSGGIVTGGVHDGDTHARPCPRHGRNKLVIHPTRSQVFAQKPAKIISPDRPAYPRRGTIFLRRHGLIAAFAAKFGIPARPDGSFIFARQMVGFHHDIIVQAADDKDDGTGHSDLLQFSFRLDGPYGAAKIQIGGGPVALGGGHKQRVQQVQLRNPRRRVFTQKG